MIEIGLSAMMLLTASDPSVIPVLTCPEGFDTATRAEMYVGRASGTTQTGEPAWDVFVRDEVRARFGEGFTILDSDGGWLDQDGRELRERAKVIIRVYPGGMTAEDLERFDELASVYRERFRQESVMTLLQPVCVRF
ncbi:DUF3574 domain-containing protein [Hyphobacterium sp. SN044]|uniref:DUF3574 domain-containing protein n=1 Tax=Hyphobacterium sp. SN044 TaxID=2912575 RepID=UPI001F364956|nr:DUF3574 domain-containing protein [Hyphobacterium sp. SN044]MCF8878644.1 DUF3574 domain-containing protein [Hyphobacterium sp. SN044]